jgi:hypothetical protein
LEGSGRGLIEVLFRPRKTTEYLSPDIIIIAEHIDRAFSTPASYSKAPGSNLGSEADYPQYICVLLSPSTQILG